MEQVHYFGGWVEGSKSLWCQGFTDRQKYRTGGGAGCITIYFYGWGWVGSNPVTRSVFHR